MSALFAPSNNCVSPAESNKPRYLRLSGVVNVGGHVSNGENAR